MQPARRASRVHAQRLVASITKAGKGSLRGRSITPILRSPSDSPSKLAGDAGRISPFALARLASTPPSQPIAKPRAIKILKEQDVIPSFRLKKSRDFSLPSLDAMQKALQEEGVLTICGAPGSGKTEILDLATEKKVEVFDLKQSFLNHHFQKNKIGANEQDKIWKQGYYDLKKEEKNWIDENYDAIKEKLLKSDQETIVFDEFDLSKKETLTPDEIHTATKLFQMAQELRAAGKKVVFILHPSGIHTPEIIEGLRYTGLWSEQSFVALGYLNADSEKEILSKIGLNKNEIDIAQNLLEGHPSAYIPFFKKEADKENSPLMSFNDFMKSVWKKVTNNYNVVKTTATPEINQLLIKIAHGEIDLTDPKVKENAQQLLETGMMGIRDGKLIMPKICREVISSSELLPHVATEENALLHANLKDSYNYALENCGGVLVVNQGDRLIPVPKNPLLLDLQWKQKKQIISDFLEIDHLPQEKHQPETFDWENSASTVEALREDAKAISDSFLSVLEGICKRSGTRSYQGENNQFLIKSAKSIDQKVKTWSQFGQNPAKMLLKVNDCIRGTVVCDSVEKLKEALHIAAEEAKAKGWEIVFSNKFDENYPGGYVGVHAKVLMPIPGTNRKIQGELQFHLQEIHDGTMESTKEAAHQIYAEARVNKLSAPLQIASNQVSKLLFQVKLVQVQVPTLGVK